jgi:hypothetical protein
VARTPRLRYDGGMLGSAARHGSLAVSCAALALACSADPSAPGPAALAPADDGAPPPAAATAPSPPPAPAPAPAPPPAPAGPPAALTCLAAHYDATVTGSAGDWGLRLADGTTQPWDDGLPKTFDDRLERPDLQDTLSIPYAVGAISPVSTKDHDPGRIRHDVMFKSAFGDAEAAVRARLVDVTFVGQTVKFHAKAAAALARVSTRLEAAISTTPALSAYVTGTLGGTFEWRPIANTQRMSAHSYGIAIDIVVSKSDYWEWDKTPQGTFTWTNRIPQAIVDAFEAEGFAWGGRWYHYDTMHFEYRPELFDARCKL